MDFNQIIARSKAIITDPTNTWPQIAGDGDSIKDVYAKYLLALAAIGPIAGIVGGLLSGSIGTAVGVGVVAYVMALVFTFVGSWLIAFIGKSFDGNGDHAKALKLVTFASIPSFLAGVLRIHPMLALIGLLLSLYGIYLFWTGITPCTGVPENKRLIFWLVSIVVSFIAYMILAFFIAIPFGFLLATSQPMN